MPRFDRALVILPLLTASASADAPPSEPVALDIIAGSTGCTASGGPVSVTMSPDNTTFTVTYDSVVALVGVGAQSVDFRKSCVLSVSVHAPPGFTYAVDSADYGGFASLAAGSSATARTSYFFQGQVPTVTIAHSISGPFLDSWQFHDTITPGALLFAPCHSQRNLNIIEDIRVNVGTSNPATTTSFFALEPPVTYHLAWARCP